MKPRPAATALALAAIALTAAVGCTATKTVTRPSSTVTVTASTPADTAVSAVPGTSNNEYKAGPFDVRLVQGITKLPSRFNAVAESGKDIPEYGSVVVVKNISQDFTGWVSPDLEYVKGHSVKGEVVDRETADPDAGGGGGLSDPLAPGQSETLYAQYQGTYQGSYVDAQLIQVQYGAAGTGRIDAPTLQLKY